jgi:hypothetical protein
MRLYLNGELVASKTLTAPGGSTSDPLLIGQTSEAAYLPHPFQGGVDDVRLWNVVRTQDQIKAAKDAALTGSEPGLALYLPLDETGGRVAADPRPDRPSANLRGRFDAVPGAVVGQIDHPGQVDRFTFTLEQAQRLYFDALFNAPLLWTLTGPQGAVVSQRDLRSSDSIEGFPVLDLPAGQYTLEIDATGDDIGPYAFRLLDAAGALALPLDAVVAGVLAEGSTTTLYRFDVPQGGGRYFFDSLATTGSAYWRLVNPYGDQVFRVPTSNDVDVQTLTIPGTYILSVEGRNFETDDGTFRFNVRPVADDAQAITLASGFAADPVWSDGEIAGALKLRGLEWISVPNGPLVDQRGDVTFELWFNAEAFPNTWMPLIYKGNGINQRTYDLWLNRNGSLSLSTRDATGQQVAQSSSGLVAPGEWYHVAGVIDRSSPQPKMLLYLNGVQVASSAVRPAQALSFATPLMIGGTSETDTTYAPFYGRIDEVRVWTVARTASQILSAKNAALPDNDRAGLVLYMPLDETTGRLAHDASASGANGTLRRRFDNVPGAVEGEISVRGQVDRYAFALDAQKRIYFDSLISNGIAWTLAGPRGEIVSNRQLRTSDSLDAASVFDLVAGNYTLTINAAGDDIGPYAFRLLDAAAAIPSTPGTAQSGQLLQGSTTELYRFDVPTGGGRYFFDFQQFNNADTYWRLISPYGDQVLLSEVGTDRGPITLARAGTYTESVEGRSSLWLTTTTASTSSRSATKPQRSASVRAPTARLHTPARPIATRSRWLRPRACCSIR